MLLYKTAVITQSNMPYGNGAIFSLITHFICCLELILKRNFEVLKDLFGFSSIRLFSSFSS